MLSLNGIPRNAAFLYSLKAIAIVISYCKISVCLISIINKNT